MQNLETASDAQLCAAHVAGQKRAFALLYDRHSAWCFARISRLVPNSADAEEVQQEVWITLQRSLPKYEPRAQFRTYLNSIINSRACEHWRRTKRRPVTIEPVDNEENFDIADTDIVLPDGIAQSNQAVALFTAALAGLSADAQAVFRLKEGTDMSWDAIADTLGIPLETARTRHRRACAALKNALRDCLDLT